MLRLSLRKNFKIKVEETLKIYLYFFSLYGSPPGLRTPIALILTLLHYGHLIWSRQNPHIIFY